MKFSSHRYISNTRYFDFLNDNLIVIDDKSKNIIVYDREFNLIDRFNGAYEGLVVYNEKVLDYRLKGKDFHSNKYLEPFKNKSYVIHNEDNLIVKEVDYKKRLVQYFITNKYCIDLEEIYLPANPIYFYDNKLICRRDLIYAYDYNWKKTLWQVDVSQLGPYNDYNGEHQGEIKQVYSYKNQIIVSITRGVVSFELETGKLLWYVKFEDFNPNELHLSGNKAYLAKGIYYAAIDLDKGEKILETNLGENINVDGIFVHRVNARPDIVIYNNKIWHLDRQDNKYFLFSHDPGTGKIINKQYLQEINNPCYTPRFNDNHMYILDSENTLHIYQEE